MIEAFAPMAAATTGIASDVAASGLLMAGFFVVAVWTLFVAALASWSAVRTTIWRVRVALAGQQGRELT